MQSYSKFANNEDIKKGLTRIDRSLNVKASGIPFFYDEDSIYVDDKDSHTVVIGSTGSGKTQSTVLPQLRLSMLSNESMVVIDEMGELYKKLGKELNNRGYKTFVVNFQEPEHSNNFNPLLIPYHLNKNNHQDVAMRIVENIGNIIFNQENKESDPFWSNSAKNYFVGLTLYLFENAKEEEINFNSIYELSNQIESTGKGKEILESLTPTNPANINLAATILAPNETRGGILSVFRQGLGTLISRTQISSILSTSDFDLEKIVDEKFALFIIGEPVKYVSKYITVIIDELYNVVNLKGKREKRINVILDRFTELSPIEDFHNVLSRSRSLNIRFTILIDSITSLVLLYGREETLLIYNNIATIIYLYSSDEETLRKISELAGNESEHNPLISVQELKTFKIFEALILKVREYPIKTKMIADYQLPWNMSEEEIELPTRKETELKIYHI
ncbi:MAG: type IV secretory system conjugative DNA transfer family protein [Bacilli bacterium]|nr:type IV secretory system conjugative DNA transfer family protein [Bacilli bacterium]